MTRLVPVQEGRSPTIAEAMRRRAERRDGNLRDAISSHLLGLRPLDYAYIRAVEGRQGQGSRPVTTSAVFERLRNRGIEEPPVIAGRRLALLARVGLLDLAVGKRVPERRTSGEEFRVREKYVAARRLRVKSRRIGGTELEEKFPGWNDERGGASP